MDEWALHELQIKDKTLKQALRKHVSQIVELLNLGLNKPKNLIKKIFPKKISNSMRCEEISSLFLFGMIQLKQNHIKH